MQKLYKCYGKKCTLNQIKHPLSAMKQFKTDLRKNFCHECYDTTEENRRQREILNQFLFHVFQENVSYMVKAQIKRFEDDGYTLENIRLSVDYFLKVRGGELFKNKGIAIVPYVHDEMLAYYKDKQRKIEETKIVDRGTIKVTMKYPTKKFDYKQEKTINLEELANAIKK